MALLRVGILGSGGWASRHATALEASEKVKLVAVAGGPRAPAFAEKFGRRREESPEALCQASDVELVDVVTPHGYHADHVCCAAEHGKHVLVEKPMATTVADCDRMIAAAERNGVKLMVAHSRRFFPLVKQAKQLLDDGAIGKVLMLRTGDDWQTVRELPAAEADPVFQFLREEVESLADAVENDTDPPVTAAEGRHAVEVIEAAYRSSQTGQAVYLPS